jgi:hypothetical protein
MSIPEIIMPAILETILGHIAPYFLTSTRGDLPAAMRTLAAFDAGTEEEMRFAAEIVSFDFHALDALSQAATPDLSLNEILRLRGSAVSLSRESRKSQRKLDQLQRARLASVAKPPAAPVLGAAAPTPVRAVQDKPDAAQALGLIEFARQAIRACREKGGARALALARQECCTAERIAKNSVRNRAGQSMREASEVTQSAATGEQDDSL